MHFLQASLSLREKNTNTRNRSEVQTQKKCKNLQDRKGKEGKESRLRI
jgi:hypothetical protein